MDFFVEKIILFSVQIVITSKNLSKWKSLFENCPQAAAQQQFLWEVDKLDENNVSRVGLNEEEPFRTN